MPLRGVGLGRPFWITHGFQGERYVLSRARFPSGRYTSRKKPDFADTARRVPIPISPRYRSHLGILS